MNVACSLKVEEDVAIGVVYNCVSGAAIPYADFGGKSINLLPAADLILSHAVEGF